jgi:glutaredoxin 3
MKSVTIYTTPFCGYCFAAKRLLTAKGVAFEEIDVSADPARRGEMVQRAMGRRTVPQVFIGGEGVGGFEEIAALDRAGQLAAMLGDA